VSTVSGIRLCSTPKSPNNTPFGELVSIATDLIRPRKKILQKKGYLQTNNNTLKDNATKSQHINIRQPELARGLTP
jgi:hypothetical protein